MDGGLNPFCFGIWGLRYQKTTMSSKNSSLNPFCFGEWGLSRCKINVRPKYPAS